MAGAKPGVGKIDHVPAATVGAGRDFDLQLLGPCGQRAVEMPIPLRRALDNRGLGQPLTVGEDADHDIALGSGDVVQSDDGDEAPVIGFERVDDRLGARQSARLGHFRGWVLRQPSLDTV